MFGYVQPDLPNMYVKDTVLYKSVYCGLCKGIGKCCGVNGRFTLNYDLAFLSVFLHNVMNIDVDIKKQHCVLHHIRKRPVAVPDELTERIGCFNVILAYYKVKDDIIDNKKGQVKKSFLASAYKKAKKKEPILDKLTAEMYVSLRKYESKNSDSVDMIADSFANLLKQAVKELSKESYTDVVGEIAYNLGKWVYLIDAVDDFEKDKKKKSYNVFLNLYKDCNTKKELFERHREEIEYIFYSVLGDITSLSKQIEYKFNHDLLDNIFILGLREKTKKIMEK